MIEPAWRLASAWRVHVSPFDSLRVNDRAPRVPVFTVAFGEPYPPFHDVRSYWSHLPPHPNVLAPVESDDKEMCVYYAALDWARRQTSHLRTLVRWARQLIAVFKLLSEQVRFRQLGLFLRPVVKIDVGHHIRVGFLPLHEEHEVLLDLPMDIAHGWPAFDPADLVYIVGQHLQDWNDVDDSKLRIIVYRACEPRRARRFKSLRELDDALAALDPGKVLRSEGEVVAWRSFDEGAGWLELGQPERALMCFEEALKHNRDLGQAIEGVELASAAMRPVRPPPSAPARPLLLKPSPWGATKMAWSHAEGPALAYEDMGDFRGALDLYRTVWLDPRTNLLLFAARARCHLHLRETRDAIDYAQRALAIDAAQVGALDTLVAAMLEMHWHEEALRNADRLVDLEPTSARAHYLRGKALFVNGRMLDARDAFERASKLDPKLLEAQLLRREVERVIGNARRSVRSQHAPTFDVPEQLAELRDVLVGGNTASAIDALRDARYANDADAQLLLARFLAFDRRLDEAVAVYDQLAATSHRAAGLVGKGLALLELGRPGDALSMFEQLPDDADAAEGAARALEELGRLDEAAAAYRRFIALASSGSDLRVRAAQLWLHDRVSR